jgi:hypothetical protein
MTVTLPSPARMALALIAIAAVFVAAMAIGRGNRPPAPRVGPTALGQTAAPQSPTVFTPPIPPPPPALKLVKPRVPVVRVERFASVI